MSSEHNHYSDDQSNAGSAAAPADESSRVAPGKANHGATPKRPASGGSRLKRLSPEGRRFVKKHVKGIIRREHELLMTGQRPKTTLRHA